MGDFSIDYQSDDDKEHDRVLRDFLSQGAADPSTRVEQTGRSMQGDDAPDPLQTALRDKAVASLNEPSGPTARKMAGGPTPDVGIGPAAALILDAFVNHGRGAGEITGATVNSIDADRRAEQTRLDHVAEIEARRKDKDPMAALISYGNLQDRTKELNEVKMRRVDQSAATQRANYDPNSTEAKGKAQNAYDQAGNRTRAQLDVKDELNDRTGTDRADVLAKGAQAVADVKHGNAPRTSADKAADIEIVTPATATRAGAEAEAKVPAQKELQQNAHDLAAGLKGTGRPAFPGTDVSDDAAWATTGGNATTFNKEKAAHEADLQQDQALETMKAIRKRAGIEPFSSADKSAYQAAHGALMGAQAKKDALGTLQQGERKMLEEIDPTLDPHISDAKDWILNKFAHGDSPPTDTVLSQLEGLQSQGRMAADTRAGVSGYKNRWGAAPAAPAAPEAPLADDPNKLSVTGKGRAAAGPLVSDAISGSKGPGLDENGLSTGDDPTETHHYRSRKTGQVIAVKATAAEKAARPGLEWVD